MKKYNVLIFPAGTEIGLEIHNALKYNKYINLFGGSSVLCHGEFVFKNMIYGFPFIKEEGFIEFLNKIINENNIDYIYPAYDDVCLYLTKNQDEIKAKIVTSPIETVEICRSKNKTYSYFKEYNFIPKFYNDISDVDIYPVFVKPSIGQGSEDVHLTNNEKELQELVSGDKEYSICEYLPGKEFTVDCFTDKNRELRSITLRDRERIKNGISVRSKILNLDAKIKEIANIINSKLVFNGAWFFQVKKDVNNEYKLLEISARIPGTMGVSRNLGINYPLLTLYNMWGYDIDIINNDNDLLVDRALISRYKTNINYSTVYIDFDDCIHLEEQVNVKILAFLYQCINKNKKIVLLTKHSKNIYDSLDKFKISKHLFNEIININKGKEKYEYINDLDSIFIDDSFSERKKVFDKLKIPVFDLDMIESLFDWRV